jgi:hypothetical protein
MLRHEKTELGVVVDSNLIVGIADIHPVKHTPR